MKLSIAMTTWNSPRFLKEQLDSLKNQTRPADEVIIVDDASNDDTALRVESYISQNGLLHWKVIRQSENGGYIKAFQKALSLCEGDVLLLCDHDDIWLPDKLEKMEQAFHEHPEIQLISSRYVTIDENGKRLDEKEENYTGSLKPVLFEQILPSSIGPGCTMALRKDLAETYCRDFSHLSMPHDWALAALAAARDGLYLLDLPLIEYRLHGGNTIGLDHRSSYSKRQKASEEEDVIKKGLLEIAEGQNVPAPALKKAHLYADFFDLRHRLYQSEANSGFLKLIFSSKGEPALLKTAAADLLAVLKTDKL